MPCGVREGFLEEVIYEEGFEIRVALQMESREGMELWISLVCLQNGRRAWWLDDGLGEGEARIEGKLQRPMGLG